MNTIIYHKIQDGCYFRICTSTSTKGIVGCGKSNLASNNVEDIDLPIVFVSIASKVLLTPINEISHSKEALILYGRVQEFMIELSTVCLCGLHGKLDTLLHLYYYELLMYHTSLFPSPIQKEKAVWLWETSSLRLTPQYC